MAKSLTNILYNMIFSNKKSDITSSNLDNGDVAFCSEDKSITLKYNNTIYDMGYRPEGTILTLENYKQLLNIDDDSNYPLDPSIPIPETEYNSDIIGVACTGEFDENGAKLAWIDKDFNEVTNLTTSYFDKHLSYQFTDHVIGNDEMIKIPIAFWWRGTIPKGPFKDKWGMLLSPNENPGIEGLTFYYNCPAFKRGVTRFEYFYISKYRARSVNDVITSTSTGKPIAGLTTSDAISKITEKSTNFYMLLIQQWHEILARAVIEKKSFQIVPESDRNDISKCKYRGIEEFCYDDYTDNDGVGSEWMAGMKIFMDKKLYIYSNDNVQYDYNGWYYSLTLDHPYTYSCYGLTEFANTYYYRNIFFPNIDTSIVKYLTYDGTLPPSNDNKVLIPDGQTIYSNSIRVRENYYAPIVVSFGVSNREGGAFNISFADRDDYERPPTYTGFRIQYMK